ncbi:Holliday junction branch migration protein RuvA [Tissierella praeacuta]|uniref:Holliday junction branch migration protein RuvA n=1 Tax=Tissierella praeacuta TaxID=43131 RepID=UPI00333EA661
MFEFIIGDIVSIKEDYIVLQNNGIGYKIFTSTNTMLQVELGMQNAMIFTYLNVREDGVFLYGFTSEEELDMFKLLQMVSKIGPKIALGVLSTLNYNQIKLAIIRKDIDILCKAPGIGKKTAERIVLELKDRIDKNIEIEEEDISNSGYETHMEAINGLMSLGYTRIEVEKIIKTIDISNMDIEDIIRETLKRLSKH